MALLAEYDALRGIGHGCGHNLIGTAAVAAGLAAKALAMTALDLFYDGSLLQKVKEDFARYRAEAEV